jgi:hypothetical protein
MPMRIISVSPIKSARRLFFEPLKMSIDIGVKATTMNKIWVTTSMLAKAGCLKIFHAKNDPIKQQIPAPQNRIVLILTNFATFSNPLCGRF